MEGFYSSNSLDPISRDLRSIQSDYGHSYNISGFPKSVALFEHDLRRFGRLFGRLDRSLTYFRDLPGLPGEVGSQFINVLT